MQFEKIIALVFILTIFSGLQAQNTVSLSAEEVESFSKQSEQIIHYLEGTLNFLGDPEEVASEKEIIINDSYLKVFVDDKVQIEDDLDENREIALSKDVQAYLKDVDFFFKEVYFIFEVISVENFVNDKGQIYFKVSVNRNLKGITITDDTVNNNQIRYFEINLNTIDNDLKIASVYTSLPNKKQEMTYWWNNMAESWKEYFGESILIYDTLPFSSIISFSDTNMVAYKWHKSVMADTFLIVENDTIYYSGVAEAIPGDGDIYIKYDTINEKLPDTISINSKEIYSQIEKFRSYKSIDISSSILIGNLQPLSELTKLEELKLSNTLIDDLSPLRNLNKLEKLNCSGTPVTNLETLRYSSSLKEIHLSKTPLEDISVLGNLKNLEIVDISYSRVSNLHALESAEVLNLLNISGMNISNNSGIENLTNLKILIAASSNITDLHLVSNLINLQSLNIDSTNVSNLEGLSELPELNVLQANNSKISNLSPLLSLPELKLVYCDNSMVTREEAQIFIEKKPDCMVIYNTFELVSWWNSLPEVWHGIVYSRMELSNPITKEQLHEIINIKDVNLSNNTSITDLKPFKMFYRLETLNVEGTKIKSIMPLGSMRNLKSLNISNNAIESIEALGSISNLRILKCENTDIKELSQLSSNEKLEIVYADNSRVKQEDAILLKELLPECLVIYQTQKLQMWWDNLSVNWQDIFIENAKIEASPHREELQQLVDLKKLEVKNSPSIDNLEILKPFNLLEEIKISNTAITDISALSFLPNIKVIIIPNNPIFDISSISKLKDLEELNIENTSVDELVAVAQLKNLKVLNIAGTKINSLKEIQGSRSLEILIINNTNIRSLKYTEQLHNLKELRCYNTRIKSKHIETFKANHPDCEVVYY